MGDVIYDGELPLMRRRGDPDGRPIYGAVTTAGSLSIALERSRQISEEGWTAAHDDRWQRLELLMAAACYAEAATAQLAGSDLESYFMGLIPEGWPWSEAWWKPSADPVRNLEKAGALIAAEIDRVLRSREADGVETSDKED